MLADDPQAAGTTVYQPDRHRGHPRSDREGVATAGPVTDDLADELVTHDDVAVGVVKRPSGRVVDREFRMVHEVDVGRTDRGAQGLEEQITRSWDRIRGVPDSQLAALQYDCTHQFTSSPQLVVRQAPAG